MREWWRVRSSHLGGSKRRRSAGCGESRCSSTDANVMVRRWAAGPIARPRACSAWCRPAAGRGSPPSTSTVPETRSGLLAPNASRREPAHRVAGEAAAVRGGPGRRGRRRASPRPAGPTRPPLRPRPPEVRARRRYTGPGLRAPAGPVVGGDAVGREHHRCRGVTAHASADRDGAGPPARRRCRRCSSGSSSQDAHPGPRRPRLPARRPRQL